MHRVGPGAIRSVLAQIMRAGGCTEEEADVTADHLVDASLCGHDSHGVPRIARYHQWLANGTIVPRTQLTTLLDTGALLQLDGGRGIGQWLAREATALGVARAKANGTAIVALRRASHIGRLGAYAEMACAAGIVSIQFANVAGSSLVAPFGAAERRISTAPVAIGVPNGTGNAKGEDFILDFATSFVAEGKALVAAKGGTQLPDGALVDGEGRLTADPRALYGDSLDTASPDPRGGDGALRTMGEHKGSGLALACELLAGALTGNGTNGTEQPFGNGWFAVFVIPRALMAVAWKARSPPISMPFAGHGPAKASTGCASPATRSAKRGEHGAVRVCRCRRRSLMTSSPSPRRCRCKPRAKRSSSCPMPRRAIGAADAMSAKAGAPWADTAGASAFTVTTRGQR